MKTTVVCGLLGSGKTTFIRHLVRGMAGKTVVLVNDFGAAGIDGEIFSAGGIESVELPSGCVCCTLKFDLITTIKKIMEEFSPEHLVIEPSGVASPSGVLETLESAGVGLVSVVGVIDAPEFTELYESGMYGSFFEDQITNADVILVNKIDLANEAMVLEVMGRIESINPQAVMFRTKNAKIDVPLEETPATRRELQPYDPHFHFDTLSFRFKADVAIACMTNAFHDLARGLYGTVVRAKALVRTDQGPYRFDISFGRIDRAPFEKNVEDSRVVVIGTGLDRAGLETTLSKMSDSN
jgi:G3E family GTPase